MGQVFTTFTAGDELLAAGLNNDYPKLRDGRIELLAGESIDTTSVPKPYYVMTTDGSIGVCDANDKYKVRLAGFVIAGQNLNQGDWAEIVSADGALINGFSGLTPGACYFVQDDQTIGTSMGTYPIQVGYAVSATQLLLLKKTRIGNYIAITAGVVYQAPTDGYVMGKVQWTGGGNKSIEILTDASNPPTTSVAHEDIDTASGLSGNPWCSAFAPVKRGNYYTITGSTSQWFVPVN